MSSLIMKIMIFQLLIRPIVPFYVEEEIVLKVINYRSISNLNIVDICADQTEKEIDLESDIFEPTMNCFSLAGIKNDNESIDLTQKQILRAGECLKILINFNFYKQGVVEAYLKISETSKDTTKIIFYWIRGESILKNE